MSERSGSDGNGKSDDDGLGRIFANGVCIGKITSWTPGKGSFNPAAVPLLELLPIVGKIGEFAVSRNDLPRVDDSIRYERLTDRLDRISRESEEP